MPSTGTRASSWPSTACVQTLILTGGTHGWAAAGQRLDRPASGTRTVRAMERQVRLTVGALTNSCDTAALLGKLPHNRPRATDLDRTLAALAPRRRPRGRAPT
jgi:hypothetical protein